MSSLSNLWGQGNAGELPAALKNKVVEYQQEVEKHKAAGNKSEATRNLNSIALIYWENNQLPSAIEYYSQSLALNKELGNFNAIATINNNIGMIYYDLGQNDKSITYLKKALEARQQIKDKSGIASAHINLALVFSTVAKYEESNRELEHALKPAVELNDIKLLRSCYSMLSENYQKMGNSEKSIEYFNYYSSFDKKINKEEIKKKEEETDAKLGLMQAQTRQVQAEKAAKELQLKNTEKVLEAIEQVSRERQMQIDLLSKEKALKELAIKAQEARLKSEALLRNSFIGGFVSVALFAFVLFRGYKEKKKINGQLESQNKEIYQQKMEIQEQKIVMLIKRDKIKKAFAELKDKSFKITSSITYAKRIQEAMLSDETELQKIFPESFILFKPRDIVSGDFYWFTKSNDDKIIITAVDCTGHGVPGAFMSMIGNSFLNEIESKGIREADKILAELHKGVRKALKQDETDNKDGMDMALCVIDKKNKVLEFAGAKNPLVYIQKNEMHEIKGDKMPIGGFQGEKTEKAFTKTIVPLTEPTTIYIFSDGFQDQFGGSEGRKFMLKHLKYLFMGIHQRPFATQKAMLDTTLEDWKGEKYKQVDDVLIIGFKIDPNKLDNES